MAVTDIRQDHENHVLAFSSTWAASVADLWQLWADPRRLERWWGPPTYPATFTEHDLRPDGRASYFMTGPDGQQYHGWWHVTDVVPGECIVIRDGFADDQGRPNDELPVSTMTVTFAPAGDRSTDMSLETQFASHEAMEQTVAMGVVEGMTAAMGQIDDILAGS
jgi:uncharacterized protein YndB with AHSA1/START domain